MTLKNYDEFCAYVDEIGVLSFFHNFDGGIPRLGELTTREQWHTGDPDTDPWQWKDRAAGERRLAFGCVLGGHKGFISRRLYSLFFAACVPGVTLEERYEDGRLPQSVWKASLLFDGPQQLSSTEVRKALGVSKKHKASQADQALNVLQREFYITICGNKQRVSAEGLPYGWPANAYARVEFFLADWLEDALLPTTDDARVQIINHCLAAFPQANSDALFKELFL